MLAISYGMLALYYQQAASTAANLGVADQTVGEFRFLAITSWIAGVVVAVLAIPLLRGFGWAAIAIFAVIATDIVLTLIGAASTHLRFVGFEAVPIALIILLTRPAVRAYFKRHRG